MWYKYTYISNERNGKLRGECVQIYLSTGKACWEQVVKVVADYPFHNLRLANKIADMYNTLFLKKMNYNAVILL